MSESRTTGSEPVRTEPRPGTADETEPRSLSNLSIDDGPTPSLKRGLILGTAVSTIIEVDLDLDEQGNKVSSSYEQLQKTLAGFNSLKPHELEDVTGLTVRGEWISSFEKTGTGRDTRELNEWRLGNKAFSNFIPRITGLKSFVWATNPYKGLPFMPALWDVLPRHLEELVLTLSNPVDLNVEDNNSEHFLTSEQMSPLQEFSNLKVLRLYDMRSTYQSIVWKTVFKNPNMHSLSMSMLDRPIIREAEWVYAEDVSEFRAPTTGPGESKGCDGRGILHYRHGTGEYLDDMCIRKARILAGSDSPMPLRFLGLGGFVIDDLPFTNELRTLHELEILDNCVDAGFRPPANGNEFIVRFPNWTGIFDGTGQLKIKPEPTVTDEGPMAPSSHDKKKEEEASPTSADAGVELEKPVRPTFPKIYCPIQGNQIPTTQEGVEPSTDNKESEVLSTVSNATTTGGAEARIATLATPITEFDGSPIDCMPSSSSSFVFIKSECPKLLTSTSEISDTYSDLGVRAH